MEATGGFQAGVAIPRAIAYPVTSIPDLIIANVGLDHSMCTCAIIFFSNFCDKDRS